SIFAPGSRTSSRPCSARDIIIHGPAGRFPRAGRLGGGNRAKGIGSLWRATAVHMLNRLPPKTPDPVRLTQTSPKRKRGFEMSPRLPSLALRASVASALAALACSGCATYAERTLKLHNAYYDNQLAAAQTAVAEQ